MSYHTETQAKGWALAQKWADDALRIRPRVAVLSVIEVRFLRGEGMTEADPVREVIALFRENGDPIVEIDPHMADS